MENKSKYSIRKLAQCLSDVREGKLSQRRASQIYGIPRTTIFNKLSGRSPLEICSRGPEPPLVKGRTSIVDIFADGDSAKYFVMNNETVPKTLIYNYGRVGEKLIVEWAQKCADRGFPVTRDGLTFTIKTILQSVPDERKRKHRLKENPGKHYVDRFLKRHKKEIKLKPLQSLTKAQNNVSEQDIRQWFARTEEILRMENCFDALKDPCRVFNTDLKTIYLNSQGGKFISAARKPIVRVNDNDDESNITALFTASADGSQVPPFILFKYKRIPPNIIAKCPQHWAIGYNENGSMTSENFYEYVVNIFHPYLERNNIQRPVILFMDGHLLRLSVPLSNFCAEHEIVPVCLIAAATHILQPLDISFFCSLKLYWRQHLRNYRLKNNCDINKSDAATEIKEVLTNNESNLKLSIRSGFRATGLYPFDVNNVKFEEYILQNSNESINDQPIESTPNNLLQFDDESTNDPLIESTPKFTHLKLFEELISPAILEQFYKSKSHGKWCGDIELKGYFEDWLDAHNLDKSYNVYVLDKSVKLNNIYENNVNSDDLSTSVHSSTLHFNDDENYDIDYGDDSGQIAYHLVSSERSSPESDIRVEEKNKGNVSIASTSNTNNFNVYISIPSTSLSNDTPIDEDNCRESNVHISIPSTSFSNVTPTGKKNSRESNVVFIPSINTEELDMNSESMEIENVGVESLLEENKVDENIDRHFAEVNSIVNRTNVELRGQNMTQPNVQIFQNANATNKALKRLSIFINF